MDEKSQSFWQIMSCPWQKCHAVFMLPRNVVNRLKETHEGFGCPICRREIEFPRVKKEKE